MADEVKRRYRLTYPKTGPKGTETGVVERELTDVQADRFRRAIVNGRARVQSIELVEED